jgi:hypothetical protein
MSSATRAASFPDIPEDPPVSNGEGVIQRHSPRILRVRALRRMDTMPLSRRTVTGPPPGMLKAGLSGFYRRRPNRPI